ncbi:MULTISPECIES: CIA30 family protein [unclassified Leptolyngbya]|uniref:CIA30 family protein n=1 Tax=unclassified Leptolyngbya TaxID=2650499 RepID=UPI001F557714|nr:MULTISPECIES: CIA30 family protein [unclassified Leptolyngbya]
MAAQTLIDFSQDVFTQVGMWGALDDVVMGGVSQSRAQVGDSALLFTGDVSTANSGGFSSIRTRNFERPLDLSGWNGVELQVRGDGNRYKLFIRGEERWDGVAHAHSFDTTAGEWQTIRLPFREFVAVFRAKTVSDRPLDTSQIYAFQLMLSKFEYDGELNPRFTPGAFRLEMRSLAVYR